MTDIHSALVDMKEELLQYLSGYDGGFNHRNALRYLGKREPQLWSQILAATSFLPENAKPKQRCWHVLNDVWERPTCPVTDEYVKWADNRYLTYISVRAQMSCTDSRARRKKTMVDTYGSEHALQSPMLLKKARETTLKNYGVSNPSFSPELMEKMKETRLSRGSYRSEDEIPKMELYYLEVAKHTERSWLLHHDRINPSGLSRGRMQYHIDHRYSRIDGYRNGVPPEVIGHWTNLQMLHYSENASKNRNSDITLEQLMESYEKNQEEAV